MDKRLKNALIQALNKLIESIKNGHCDNMTPEQYNKIIECLQTIVEVRENNNKTKRKWYQLF